MALTYLIATCRNQWSRGIGAEHFASGTGKGAAGRSSLAIVADRHAIRDASVDASFRKPRPDAR
ncbi:MAG TPA: hypothetical protein VGH74_04540 [Planctomycetaceae bacterium]|jgi:hypothetical protein